MKTNSLTAYSENIESGRNITQKEQVMKIIEADPGITRRSIKNRLRIEYSTVCARVNDLLKEGKVSEGLLNDGNKARLFPCYQLHIPYSPRNKRYSKWWEKLEAAVAKGETIDEHYLQIIKNGIS